MAQSVRLADGGEASLQGGAAVGEGEAGEVVRHGGRIRRQRAHALALAPGGEIRPVGAVGTQRCRGERQPGAIGCGGGWGEFLAHADAIPRPDQNP